MENNHINYIEFRAPDLEAVKRFYSQTVNWRFKDYGDSYTAFEDSGIEGGFERSDEPSHGGPLVVLYHKALESCKAAVIDNGGSLTKDIFSFPGGRRFHFKDPAGNELAVWSEPA